MRTMMPGTMPRVWRMEGWSQWAARFARPRLTMTSTPRPNWILIMMMDVRTLVSGELCEAATKA